jgi:tripartite-type tricarboxylate transporter receptor subunit TctC
LQIFAPVQRYKKHVDGKTQEFQSGRCRPSERVHGDESAKLDCSVFLIAWLAIIISVSTGSRAADFYAGKTVTFLASDDAGGGFDAYVRLLARHMAKFIPGSPSVVVQNEPGAGGLRAEQIMYSVAPADGTEIGNFRASNILESILGIRGGQVDPTRFEWIGNMTTDSDLCSFWRTSGVHSFADLKNRQVLVGATGAGSGGYSVPHAINELLHTRMKIIPGYKGMGDRILAMERGEIEGGCGMNGSTLASTYSSLLSQGKLVPILQIALRPYPSLVVVPLVQSFAESEDQRRTLTIIL